MIDFKFELPIEIVRIIENKDLNEVSIGCSDSQVIRITDKESVLFLKIAKKGVLTKEYNALKWLDGKLQVPKVVEFVEYDDAEFLVTTAIKGEMSCSERNLKEPEKTLKIIAEAFNNIYNINIVDCPFNVGLDYKLSLVEKNFNANLILISNIKEETLAEFGNISNILSYLKNNRFEEELCFSHGDTSLPNILIEDSHFSGFIDVGECGIADKWFDLAICEKSIIRNFGQKYVQIFYDFLGIKRDESKIKYYLLMMELYL